VHAGVIPVTKMQFLLNQRHVGANIEKGSVEGHTPLLAGTKFSFLELISTCGAACYEANPRTFELLISAGVNMRAIPSTYFRSYCVILLML
jgi:hypothetical protein